MIFKKRVDQNRFFCLNPVVILIAAEMFKWCATRDIPFVITSTVSTLKEDKRLKRVSTSHRTCRAFDLRSWVFTEEDHIQFMAFFNRKFKNVAAVSRDGTPNLIVYHTGTAPHFHIQIHSRFALKNPIEAL